MENEILQQILNEIKGIKTDVSELKQGQAELKQGQTRIEIIIENDIKPDIKAVAEGHRILNRKLDLVQ